MARKAERTLPEKATDKEHDAAVKAIREELGEGPGTQVRLVQQLPDRPGGSYVWRGEVVQPQ